MEKYEVDKSICNVISSGSHGNAVLYHNSIMVDFGVSYKAIEPFKNQIQVLLLTHKHGDHFNLNAIKKLCFERPSLRVACGSWMVELLNGVRNIDVLEAGKVYDYGYFKVSPIVLYHDVKTFGYRIFKCEHKTIHITDTAHVQGITAKDYDLFAIEFNYNSEELQKTIEEKQKKGEFTHKIYSENSHLSEEQAKEFIFNNQKATSKVVRLHESKF